MRRAALGRALELRGLSCITTTSTLASPDSMSTIDSIIGRFMPPMSTGFR